MLISSGIGSLCSHCLIPLHSDFFPDFFPSTPCCSVIRCSSVVFVSRLVYFPPDVVPLRRVFPVPFYQPPMLSPPTVTVLPLPPPSGSCRPVPQWPPGGSQNRQVRPGIIHNANLAVIEEADRLANPKAEKFIVIKVLCLSTMYISLMSGGAQA